MKISKEIRNSIDRCVLCWLATVSNENIPNVSPKEVFTYYDKNKIIIANIASPQTVKNIKKNKMVAISFIDILLQKGYQLKGEGRIVNRGEFKFQEMEKALVKLTTGKFPFSTITEITINKIKPIIAPKYILFPETTELEQIESAKKAYGF